MENYKTLPAEVAKLKKALEGKKQLRLVHQNGNHCDFLYSIICIEEDRLKITTGCNTKWYLFDYFQYTFHCSDWGFVLECQSHHVKHIYEYVE